MAYSIKDLPHRTVDTTNFDAYLNGINTDADTEITGSPEVFGF